MNDFSGMARRFDALTPLTDVQAGELRDRLRQSRQLPSPTDVPGGSPEQAVASVATLQNILHRNAFNWDRRAAQAPALTHFADGLLYAAAMLSSCRKLELNQARALAVFTAWAESFVHDVLAETGTGMSQRQQVLDTAAQHPELFTQLLEQLPHDMARGALMAALSIYFAAVFSKTALDADTVEAFFTHAAHDLTSPHR